jgi:hypothetical protein
MPLPSDQVPPDSGSIRFKRLRLGVIVLGVLFILAFAGSSAYDAWSSYRHTLVATDREIGNISNALAEQTAWTPWASFYYCSTPYDGMAGTAG